jgi:hypothetical protein
MVCARQKVYIARDRKLGYQVAADAFSNNAIMPTGLTVSACFEVHEGNRISAVLHVGQAEQIA